MLANADVVSRRQRLFWALSTAAVVGGLLLPWRASAYHTDERETTQSPTGEDLTCLDCHGDYRDDWTGEGPHGNYTGATKKCRMCHSAHEAQGDSKLLPADTITATCFTCHDDTGAVGVYRAIVARGGSVQSAHRFDLTATVPGGTQPLSEVLGCGSCHAVHRDTAMQPFLRDTGKAFSSTEFIYSNALLRDDVGGKPQGTFTTYGGAWCAGCHDAIPMQHDHPTTFGDYTLGRPQTVPFPGSPTGIAQAGFVTTDSPRTPPYCQQCHEDARNVEATFSASFKDYGYPPPDAPTNPEYVTFPHQSTNRALLVEDLDDLCTNCHPGAEP